MRAGSPVIASQLDAVFNTAVERLLGTPVRAIARCAPTALPPGIDVLVATSWLTSMAAAQRHNGSPPPGWPFGIRWIQLFSSGIDLYPDWFLHTVPVTTSRGAAAGAISEHVLAAMLAATKGLPERWIHSPEEWKVSWAASFHGCTVAILGFGPIARAIAGKTMALGAKVRILRKSDRPLELPGAEAAHDILDLVATADHLVLAAPGAPDTTHIIDRDVLNAARPGLHLINIARGELIDDQALLDAMASGRVGLATLDVTAPEPLPAHHPYYTHPRVRLTPHISAISVQTREALAEKFVENLRRFQAGEPMLDQLPLQRPSRL